MIMMGNCTIGRDRSLGVKSIARVRYDTLPLVMAYV
jgi:hypothetical protein